MITNFPVRFFRRDLPIRAFESGLKRRPTFRYWAELERSQWLSAEAIEAIQLERLGRLLRHAAATCPYYARTWAGLGLEAEDLRSLDDLERWPLLRREQVAGHRAEMRSSRPNGRLIAKATGGSSGVPLGFDLDEESNDRRMAAWHRGYGWAGAEPGTKQLYLWGVPLGERSRRARLKDAIYNALYRRRVLNCFELSESTVEDFLARLNRYRAEVIVAYVNPLYEFARALEARGLEPKAPRSIIVGAEKLHPFQRERIERVFRAPVFETYGSREFMLIGTECEHHAGLHVTAEHLIVEVVDDEGRPCAPGEEGNLAITDLFNTGMPFIRYINGDRAIAAEGLCPCGRGLPRLERVVGRRLDTLRTPDGRLIPGEFFPHLLKDFAAIRRFQVVQDRPDRIRLDAVIAGPWGEVERLRLDREVRAVIGSNTEFDLVAVDEIPLTAAGKHRVVVNLCPMVEAPAAV